MRNGHIEQTGSPAEIYNFPRNAFVADFVGSSNLIEGQFRTDLAGNGLIALETPSGHVVYGMAHGRAVGAALVLSVRRVHLRLSFAPPLDTAGTRNVWPVRVRRCVFEGDFTQIHVTWGDRELVLRCIAQEPIEEGREAYLYADPAHCILLDPA
jgi:iron(III) transport system ATP-binding protein